MIGLMHPLSFGVN